MSVRHSEDASHHGLLPQNSYSFVSKGNHKKSKEGFCYLIIIVQPIPIEIKTIIGID